MSEAEDRQRYRDQDEESTQKRATLLGLTYFDTRGLIDSVPLIKDVITIQEMYDGNIVPLRSVSPDQNLVFAITIQTPQRLLRDLPARFVDSNLKFVMMSVAGFKEIMQRYDPPKVIVYDDVKIATQGDSQTIDQVSRTLESVKSDDVLSYLVTQADRLTASDIHIECQRDDVRIRFRVDGTLHPVAMITADKYRVLTASVASKANISTASKDAQTGHMQFDIKKPDNSTRTLNIRIETVPTIYGQDVVMRLFNFDAELLNLKSLGLSQHNQDVFESVVKHPHGMVLIVGPTGSGKSTTLYSMINALNNPGRKILTLEDPVEYGIPGVSQIPVNTSDGDSFAEKLRAVLRLDPDVIMVGEIRDADTAKTAIQASITGHLVLSTFHAATAATAFSRVVDMIGQNPIFSTAIRLIVGQRLVRRLDKASKIAYSPDEATKSYIKQVLANLPDAQTIDYNNLKLYRPGKSAAAPFGYVGRIVLMEQMPVTEKIQAFLRGDIKDVSASAIEAQAKVEGMITLEQDGVLKTIAGLTTLEEVYKVI